jgi:hypothetical protein
MAIPGFFKQNKPRGFNYVPRYYDPVKEEMEERRRARGTEHRAQGSGQEVQNTEPREQAEGTDRQRSVSGAERRAQSTGQRAQSEGQGAQSGVYRSRIMRGDMKNYFHRKNERVQKYTMIRILVIALIMMLVIYLYLRF